MDLFKRLQPDTVTTPTLHLSKSNVTKIAVVPEAPIRDVVAELTGLLRDKEIAKLGFVSGM